MRDRWSIDASLSASESPISDTVLMTVSAFDASNVTRHFNRGERSPLNLMSALRSLKSVLRRRIAVAIVDLEESVQLERQRERAATLNPGRRRAWRA